MRHYVLSGLLTLALATHPLPAQLDLKGKSLAQTFEELLPKLDTQASQQAWQNICFQLSAPNLRAQRSEACKLMAARLDKGTPVAARIWLLKQLERMGREECVEALAAAVDDPEPLVRDAAVRALTNNPAGTAVGKLTAKLPASKGTAKVGLLNALGQRADATAVDAVAKELSSADPAVAIAAARTLGCIATPEAGKALAAMRGQAKDQVRLAMGDAYLRCADKMLREGKREAASAIYQELHQSAEPRPIRLAALQGLLKAAGDQAGTMVLKILRGDDADARAIAIGQIDGLSAGALKPLAANLDQLPPGSQVLVLTAMAARGDKSLLPSALAAAKSNSPAVQRAGIQALGQLGDASVVPLLLDRLFAGGNLGSAAADSLVQLAGDGVNEQLIAALAAQKMAGRLTSLISVLERRKAVTAVPALLQAANHDDAAIRTAAFAALKGLAEPKDVRAMVLALVKTGPGKEREQAELAVVAVCSRIADTEKRAEPVLTVLKDSGEMHRAVLLPLLGRLGGVAALPPVKEALASPKPELRAAGVLALCNWPEPSVSGALLELVQGAKDEQERRQALQAVIRINTTQPSDRSNDARLASLAALKKAMELSNRVEDRRLILDGIGFVRTMETYRYVLPFLDDKELQQSACRALVELAHSRTLREPHQAEFNKTLDRVIGLCKDKGLIDRARQYQQQ